MPEKSDRLLKPVVDEIARRQDDREDRGEIAILNLRGARNEIVHGSSFVFTDDPEPIKKSKLNRISVSEIYSHIRGLNFDQFEVFGRCVLRELG